MFTKIKGFATPEGTERFKIRFQAKLAEDHFREVHGLWFSSIGAGSYLGEPNEETDRLYVDAFKEAVRSGVNVLDSAVNYRSQRSERSIGEALRDLLDTQEISREELILCTKGGYLPFDKDYPANPSSYFQKTYVESGILKPEELVQGCHAMTPRYLEDQLERSLQNLVPFQDRI